MTASSRGVVRNAAQRCGQTRERGRARPTRTHCKTASSKRVHGVVASVSCVFAPLEIRTSSEAMSKRFR
eukprot:2732017-Lingulodinium_polyedra.AAC.1